MKPEWTIDYSEEAMAPQLRAAEKNYENELQTKALATSAQYNADTQLIEINLKNGSTFTVPPYSVQGLRGGTPEQLNDIWLDSDGLSIHWEQLDADFYVDSLVNGIFGTRQWMKQLEMESSNEEIN